MKHNLKNSKNNLFLVYLAFFLFLIPSGSSATLGTFKQGVPVNLVQVCDNCTSINLTKIQFPNSAITNINSIMTKDGSYYNYTFGNTGLNGQYFYTTCGNPDGVYTCETTDFTITSSGQGSILGLFIILIVMVYGIAFAGFFWKNEWVTIFGGLAMILLGLFTLNNGIDIFRNFMTESFSFITIGLGSFFAIFTSMEMIQ